MTGIGIIEDDPDVLDALERIIDRQNDFHCLGAFGSVEEARKGFNSELMPDIILTDIDLPGMSGIDGIRMIKGQYPEIQFLVLSIYHDVAKIFPALRAGAAGYLLKNTSIAEIIGALQQVRDGGSPMSPQIARLVIDEFTGRAELEEVKDELLTSREHEIVVGLVDGLSYKMIAGRMDISLQTVRYHIRNIYSKLHVHSKGEVISKSLRGEI